jgi:hypothetical protein
MFEQLHTLFCRCDTILFGLLFGEELCGVWLEGEREAEHILVVSGFGYIADDGLVAPVYAIEVSNGDYRTAAKRVLLVGGNDRVEEFIHCWLVRAEKTWS